jgi:magnesium transporter
MDAEELFLNLSALDQADLLSNMPQQERRSWIRLLPPDDAADVLQKVEPKMREELLDLLDPQTRREVSALLAYAEDQAGGLMNSRFIRLRPEMAVDEAIRYIRAQAQSPIEVLYYAYVLDSEQRLLGAVSFRDLFASPSHKLVHEIMTKDLVTVSEQMDQEEVYQKFKNTGLTAIPVVDSFHHMKGIVTLDDIVGVVQEEATEDFQKIGAVETFDEPYMSLGLFELVKKRVGWLATLFIGEMFTASAMGYFESAIERTVALALFIPLIISSGGNAGSQASTLIIRAIALREVRLRDWWRVLGRELFSGFFLGAALGVLGLIRIIFWPGREVLYGEHYFKIAFTVSLSVLGVVMWGTIVGSMLPFMLRKLGFDPASASAPFVATAVDVTGLIIYFSLASLILSGTLI